MNTLSAADMEILAFERTQWPFDRSTRFGTNSQGRKEAAVLERFGFRLTEYYRRLNLIIDDPAAVVYDPQLVNRVRRVRADAAARRNHQPIGSAS